MTQAADQQTILQHSVNAEVLLARMDERILHVIADVKMVRDSVDALKLSLEAKKTPWWQFWGPLAFFLTVTGGVYAKFEAADRHFEQVDAQSVQQRVDILRRLERLEAESTKP